MNCGSSITAKLQVFDAKSNLFASMIWIRQAIFASKIEINVEIDENVFLTQNSKHRIWSDISLLMLTSFFQQRECTGQRKITKKEGNLKEF